MLYYVHSQSPFAANPIPKISINWPQNRSGPIDRRTWKKLESRGKRGSKNVGPKKKSYAVAMYMGCSSPKNIEGEGRKGRGRDQERAVCCAYYVGSIRIKPRTTHCIPPVFCCVRCAEKRESYFDLDPVDAQRWAEELERDLKNSPPPSSSLSSSSSFSSTSSSGSGMIGGQVFIPADGQCTPPMNAAPGMAACLPEAGHDGDGGSADGPRFGAAAGNGGSGEASKGVYDSGGGERPRAAKVRYRIKTSVDRQ